MGKTTVHAHVKLDTFGGKYEGAKCIGLEILDKETNHTECYPLPLDVAEDLGHELIRLAKAMSTV